MTALHVQSVGQGPPLVLLHGFAMHGGLFAPIIPALARHHRVHVDASGQGADLHYGERRQTADQNHQQRRQHVSELVTIMNRSK